MKFGFSSTTRLWILFVLSVILWVFFTPDVFASDDECRNCGAGDVDVDVNVDAAGGEGGAGGAGGNADSATDISITNPREAPTIYLNAGQAERDCGKVIGLSGSNTSGGWALGIPIPRWMAPTCDFWKAANEAQQNGHVWTSYMFMCEIKHIRKEWGDAPCAEIRDNAFKELGIMQPPKPHAKKRAAGNNLFAQVPQEENQRDKAIIEEQQEQVEYQQVEQASEIESLQEREATLKAQVEALRQILAEDEAKKSAKREALRQGLKAYEVKDDE